MGLCSEKVFILFCFFNFMLNEQSNDKIQGVTLGVVTAAEIRVTEDKQSRD